MNSSLSAHLINTAYIDSATKAALLGPLPNSFGLPLSTLTTFKLSALDLGPVTLVQAYDGGMIIPFQVICAAPGLIPADVSGNLGWPAPNPEDTGEHDEPWVVAAGPLWFGGEELGSLVMLPNSTAVPSPRLWPECVRSRPFAVELAVAGGTRSKRGKKEEEGRAAREGDEEAPDPELSVVVFYTVF